LIAALILSWSKSSPSSSVLSASLTGVSPLESTFLACGRGLTAVVDCFGAALEAFSSSFSAC